MFCAWENSETDDFLLQVACVNGAILVILFKKMRFFSSKMRKKWKTAKKNLKS